MRWRWMPARLSMASMGLVLGWWLTGGSASAMGLQPLSQDRYIKASTAYTNLLGYCDAPEYGYPPCGDAASAQVSAPDFGPFDTTVAPTCLLLSCPSVSASQSSTIAASGIRADGATVGRAVYGHAGLENGNSSAYSRLDVSFRISEPTAYVISSLLTTLDHTNGIAEAYWYLDQAGVPGDLLSSGCNSGLFDSVLLPCGQSNVTSGVLEAGDYRFVLGADIHASGNSFGSPPTEEAEFHFGLQLVPEPATGLLLVSGFLVLGLAGRLRGRNAA